MSGPTEWTAGPDAGDAPLVSIGVPAYNSARFIRQSLESLLTQDYNNIELIVSDDGSTDETPEICAEITRRDARVVMVQGVHLGGRQNFNTVLRLARGKYFMWAADHDLWDKRFVSACVAALEADQDAILAYARSALVDPGGSILAEMDDALAIGQSRPIDRYRWLIWRLENCNAIYGLMRCEQLKGTGGYGAHPAPDHLVLAKMALRGRFIQIQHTMYFRRQNRPPERAEVQRRRQPFDLDPNEAGRWLSLPEGEYFRGLRNAHMSAVIAAPISVGDKILGLAATVACFRQRFGVRSRLWAAARRLLDLLPSALRRRALGVLEYGA